jgi:hypothetical protein
MAVPRCDIAIRNVRRRTWAGWAPPEPAAPTQRSDPAQCLVGTTAFDGADAGPVPMQLVAVTVKV